MTTKISNPVDVFHFSPDLVINEHNWANFFSYLICFDLTDIPSPPLLSCGPQGYIGQSTPLSVFERFQNLLKLTPEAHKKAVKESLERWGQNISKLTHSLLRSSETFFYRKSLVLERVVESKILMQFPNKPKLSEERINDIIKRIATNGWIFDSLPGISGLAGFKDDHSVAGLCKRLESLPALSLWTEPFDLNYDILSKLLQQTRGALMSELDALSEEERDSPKLTPALGNKFRTLMLLALQSGDFKRMTLFKLAQQCPSYHFIQHGSRIGQFRVAKNTAIQGFLNLTPALTTDSSYLYLFLAQGSHSIIYKIGTGEKGTVPGQFYSSAYDSFLGVSSNTVNPIIRWCHCDGNLLIRRAGDGAGVMHVMNASTLKIGRKFKLHMDIFKEYEQSPYFNTLFPVLTDSHKQLYAVVFFIKRVNLKIREERRAQYRKLVDMQQKEMEEQRKKEAEMQAKKAEEKAKEEKDKLKSKKRAPTKAVPKEKKEEVGTSQNSLLDPTAFILEFRVYRYDVSNLNSILKKEKSHQPFILYDPESYEEAQELRDAFNGYFSLAECAHALNISERRDMQLAAKWLVDHGVQERNCPTLIPEDYTTIAEVELDGKKLSSEILSGDASSLLKVAMAVKDSAPPSNYQFYSYGYKQAKQPGYYGYGDQWNKAGSKAQDGGRDLKSSMASMMKEFVIKEKIDEETGEKLQPILRPQDLLLGSWSVENDQLTVHLSSQETWEARIFKLKKAKDQNLETLELPLFMKSKSSEVRIDKPKQRYSRKTEGGEELQIQFKKSEESLLNVQVQDPDKMLEMYLKEAQNQPKDSPDFSEKRKVMRQKVKEALMQKRLKQVQEAKGPKEESKSPKGSAFKQEMSQKSTAYLFQPLELKSTLLVTLQSQTSNLEGSNTPVITFDTISKRYFSFCTTSPGNIGFVSVFQDLSNCANVVRDMLPEHLRLGREWDENGDDTLRTFVLELRKLLLHFEAIRYDLPWRWNLWSFNFHVAYNFYSQQLKALEGEQSKEASGPKKSVYLQKKDLKESEAHKEESKAKETKEARSRLSRLIVRLEKMLLKEEEDLRQIANYPEDISAVSSAIAKYKEVLHQKKPDPKQDKKSTVKQSIVEPQEEVIVKNHLRKVQPFCIEGDARTLEVLMDELKKYGARLRDPYFETVQEVKETSPQDRDFYLLTLHYLIIWARESDIFMRSRKEGGTVQQLYKFLLTKVKHGRDSPELMRMYWLILINGWDKVVSTLEEKGEVMESMLQIRDEPVERKQSWIYEDMMVPLPQASLLQIFSRICQSRYHFLYERSPFSPSIAQFKMLLMSEFKDMKKEKGNKKEEGVAKKSKPSLKNATHIHLVNLEDSPAKNAQKHAYFPPSPYNSYLLLHDPKPIENGHLRRHNLEEIFALYSQRDIAVDFSDEAEVEAQLKKLRSQQVQRATQLWELYEIELTKVLEECVENKPFAGERAYTLWTLFSRLLEEAFGCSDWIEPSGYSMLSRMISLFNSFFKSAKRVLKLDGISDQSQYASQLEKQLSQSPQALPIWLRMFVQSVEHISAFLLLTFPTNEDFFVALSIVEPLNLLLSSTKQLMIGVMIATGTHKLSKILMLDSSEGIDFSENKVFETPHPYQRGEPPITESFVFPSAIAIQVEIDYRSRTESQNDFLQIHSSADLNSVGKALNPNLLIQAAGGPPPISFTANPQNYFHQHLGHGFRLKGKPSLKHPLIFLGNKVTFQFQVDPNDSLSKKNMMGLPGSMFAAPGSLMGVDSGAIPASGSSAGAKAQVKKEELIRKWGFRCVCRPIFTQDLNLMLWRDTLNIPKSLDISEKQLAKLHIAPHCKPGQLSVQTFLKTVQLMSYVSSEMSKILLRGDYLAKKATKCKKLLQWHLFKGGLASSPSPAELREEFSRRLNAIDEQSESVAELREKGTAAVLNTFEDSSESEGEGKGAKEKEKEESSSENESKEEEEEEVKKEEGKDNKKLEKEQAKPLAEAITSLRDHFKNKVSKHLPLNLSKWVMSALSDLKNDSSIKTIPESIVAMIREEEAYMMTYTTEQMRPTFKEEPKRLWKITEQIIIMAMLHHGDLLEEAESFCGERNRGGGLLRGLGATAATHQREFKEQIKMIGKEVNGVMKDMLRQVHAQREFKQLLMDILGQAKECIEEERAKLYEKKKKQEIQRIEEEEEKQKQAEEKRTGLPSRFKVTKQTSAPVRKKKNVSRHFAKTGHHESKKQPTGGLVRKQSQTSEISQSSKQRKEEDLEKEKSEEWSKMSVKEINSMKKQLFEKVYDNYLSVYQGNAERCQLICLATGISYNSLEPAESLKEVFKSVEKAIKPVLSFKEKELKKVKKSAPEQPKKPKVGSVKPAAGKEEKKAPQHDEDEAKREESDEWMEVDRYSKSYDLKNAAERMDEIEKLKLGNMYEKPALDVLGKALFLLEIRASVDYQKQLIVETDKVLKRDSLKQEQKRKSVYKIAEQSKEDEDEDSDEELQMLPMTRTTTAGAAAPTTTQLSSFVKKQEIGGMEVEDEDDEDDLMPIPMSRSLSVQVQGAQASSNTMRLSRWVESNKLWRVWRKVNSKRKTGVDPLSPMTSPIEAVGLFLKTATASGEEIRKEIEIQQQKAVLREKGLSSAKDLLEIAVLDNTLLPHISRFALGTVSDSITSQVFSGIEACGANLALQINSSANRLLYLSVASACEKGFAFISKFSHIERKYKDMLDHLTSQDRADKSKLKSDELAGHTQRLLKQNMKELLLGLVDIELLLSNELTREYLHVLIQNNFNEGGPAVLSKSDKTGFLSTTKGMDLLRILPRFCECLVMLHVYLEKARSLLNFSTSISELVHHIENGSKIILYKLIEPVQSVSLVQVPLGTTVAQRTDKKTQKVQAELILQEMLLDKVVDTLRKAAYFPEENKTHNKPSNLLKPSRQQRLNNVLNLLYEILITINHTGLALLVMKRKSGSNLKELARVLSYILLHGHSPTVLKIAGLCLQILLKHIEPSSFSMLQTVDLNLGSRAGQNEFLRLAAKRVGQWISLCPSANGKYRNLANSGEGTNYLVYIQMNSTKDEDFTYILNSLWEWEARHPTFTAKYPDSVQQLLEEVKEMMASKPASFKNVKIPALRHFKRNLSGNKRSDEEENQTAKLLKQLSSYKLAVSAEVSNVEKFFEQFVNLTWEDFKFNREKLGLEEEKQEKEKPKKPEEKASHSDSEKAKETYVPDNSKVLARKLKEQNFNIRVAQHLQDAQRVISAIQHRGYGAFTLEPMRYERALELVSLLQQALEGKLPKIPINPYSRIMDDKGKEEKKLSSGKIVSSLFPLTLAPNEANPPKPSPVASQKVDLAKQRVILSMWSESVAKTVEVDVDSAMSRQQYHQIRASMSLKTQDAYLGETFNPKKEISGSRTGVARSADINAVIDTIRSVIQPSSLEIAEEIDDPESEHLSEQFGNTLSAHSSRMANRSSYLGQSVYNQKNAVFASERMKQLNSVWVKSFQSQIHYALELISGKWKSVPQAQQLEALGTLIIASGWLKSPRPGRSIRTLDKPIQDQQDGLGSNEERGMAPSSELTLLSAEIDRSGLRTSTVLSVGETERAKPPQFSQIQRNVPVSSLSSSDDRKSLHKEAKINGVKLAQALLSAFKLAERQWKSKLSLGPIDYDYGFQPFVITRENLVALAEDGSPKNMKIIEESNSLFFNGDLLLSVLLSLAAKTEVLGSESELPLALRQQVFKKLEALEQAEHVQNELTSLSEQWANEQALVSWEQLHDKVSPYLMNFFIPSQLFRASPSLQKKENKLRAPSAQELYKQHYKNKSGNEGYILPESGYERQLPQPAEGSDKTMSALRLLNHWERFIIPKIVEYVKSSFRPWEMEYYFEQLRAPLRQGDQAEALKGAMIICEKKMPAGCQIMPESYDWGANSPEECVPGNWVIARLPYDLPKDIDDSQHFKHQHPILDRWAKRGLSQVAVLIRAFHFKTNEALVEIYDHEGMRSFLEWMPVSRLSHPQIEIPKMASSFSFNIIYAQAIKSFRSVQILNAKALLLQLGSHPKEEDKAIKQIQRLVLQELGSSLVTGWIDDLNDMLVIERKVEEKGKANKTRTNRGLRDWMRDNIQSLLSKHNQPQEATTSAHDKLECLAASLEQDCSPVLKDGEFQAPPNIEKVLRLQKWLCQEVWLTLASQFKHSNSNLVAAFQDYQKIKSRVKLATIETAFQQTWPITHQERYLLPLHELVPVLLVGEGPNPRVEIPVGLILTFEEQAYLSRNSKLRFYADPAGLHLIKEIHALRNDITLEPIVFSTGRVWCLFEPGSTMLLPLHQQESAKKSALQCRITSIPANWPVAGWLTEKLSTAILSAALSPIAFELQQKGIQVPSPNKMNKQSTPFITLTAAKKLLGGLVGSLAQFYSGSQAPSPIRQVVFKLLNRLIRKRRFLAMQYSSTPPTTSVEKLKTFHFNELSLDPNWLTRLLQETHKFFKAKTTIVGTLLSSFIQEAIELIASALMPLSMPKHEMILTPRQLLPSDSGELYDWMESVVTVGMFLHYFQGEGSGLPPAFAEEVLKSLELNPKHEWSKALLIENVPQSISTDKLKEMIWERVEKHKARVIDKARSLYIPCEGESHVGVAVVLLDGWEPQYLKEDEEEEEEKKEEEPSAPAQPVIDPSTLPWYCSACTMENQATNTHCNVCGSEKGNSSHLLPGSQEEKKAEGGASQTSSPGKGAPDIRFSEIELIEAEISNQTAKRMKKLIKEIEEIWKGEKKEAKKKKKEEGKEEKKQNESEDNGESLAALFEEEDEGSGGSEEEKKKEVAEPKEEEQAKKEEGKKVEKKKEIKPEPIPPPVKVWQYHNVKDSVNFKHFASFFQNRLFPTILEDQSFTKRAKDVLHQVYDNHFSKKGSIFLPKDNQILEAMDIYPELAPTTKKESIMEEEEFLQKMLQIGTADPLALWDVLLRHGYDFYLNRGGYSLVEQLPKRPTLSIQGLSSLRELCENILCAETKAIYGFTPDCLRLLSKTQNYLQSEASEMQYSESINAYNDQYLLVSNRELGEASLLDLRFNLALLREFNKHFAVAINFINPGTLKNTLVGEASSSKFVIPMTLTSFLASCRSLCFTNIKVEMQQTIIDKTANNYEKGPRLEFERLKLAHSIEKQQEAIVQKKKGASDQLPPALFLQAFEQIRSLDLSLFRPKRVKGTRPIAFDIVFKGEHVQGEGGPYRQFFADISAELQEQNANKEGEEETQTAQRYTLDLLLPSPNNRANIGDFKHKWVLNPRKFDSLPHYEFLGILMGACIRTGVHLTLDLPSLVWRTIVAEPPTLADLEEIDLGFTNKLEFLFSASKEQFDQEIFQTASINLSDDSVLALKVGSGSTLTYNERYEFIEKAIIARMDESSRQIAAIRSGISKLVPLSLLSLSTGAELQKLVCGKRTVDLQLLERHTVYAGGLSKDSRRVKYFWKTIREISETDQLKFIKFCWGQERLPANDDEFERLHTRFMVKPQGGAAAQKNPDQCLPKADTCFFNLELSDYSTKEIMKERLLLAINTDCDSMNAEVSQHDQGRQDDY